MPETAKRLFLALFYYPKTQFFSTTKPWYFNTLVSGRFWGLKKQQH